MLWRFKRFKRLHFGRKVNVNWSRELSAVQIHIECVIGELKQRNTILQSVLPIALLSDSKGTVDKMIKSMLCICESLSSCCSPRIIFFLDTLIISFSACKQLVIISLNNMHDRRNNGDYGFFFLQNLDSLWQEGQYKFCLLEDTYFLSNQNDTI